MGTDPALFVDFFRASAAYIHAHRGRTFVVVIEGDIAGTPRGRDLARDLALMHALGIRVVVLTAIEPQIDARVRRLGSTPRFHGEVLITDDATLACVKDAAGTVRLELEALLSMGLSNSAMHQARIRVVAGNFLTAKPKGIVDGVDFQHTGEVRRVDTEAIRERLEHPTIVLLGTVGYSPTGEAFYLEVDDVAASTAIALQADKLIYLIDGAPFHGGLRRADGSIIDSMTPSEAEHVLQGGELDARLQKRLAAVVRSCRHGVRRVHLIDRHLDGGLLLELFTRNGVGTLITEEIFEGLRQAQLEDVVGVLGLVEPLEAAGILVRRSREHLEIEIPQFTVIEREHTIIGCAELLPYPEAGSAELACLAVHEDYRSHGRGDALLQYVEKRSRTLGLRRLFVLTTRTAHWFRERGFEPGELDDLPPSRRAQYNRQRNSLVLIKSL